MFSIAVICILLIPALPSQADEVSDRALQEVLQRYDLVAQNPEILKAIASRTGQSAQAITVEPLPPEMRELLKDLAGIVPPGPWMHAVSDKVILYTATERLMRKGNGLQHIAIQSVVDEGGSLTVVTLVFEKGKRKRNNDLIRRIKKQTASLSGRIHVIATEAR